MPNIDQHPRDKNGLPHGEWITHYNGKLMCRRNYVHGVLHGLDEWYLRNGNLRYYGNRNKNRRIGYWYHNSKQNEYHLCLI